MSNQEQFKKIFAENWSSVYNTILGRETKIGITAIEKGTRESLVGIKGEFQSFVQLAYGDQEANKIVLAVNNKLISIISNLMIGLDTFKDDISDDDKDAFVEAVNQMFSSCQVPIKEEMGLKMNFKDTTFVSPDSIETVISTETILLWQINFEVADIVKERLLIITPEDFGQEAHEEVILDESIPILANEKPRKTSPVEFEGSNIDLLMDVELPITIRIGSTDMKLIDIMSLGLGSIIELEKLVDDPVEVLVNDKLVAKGEIVVYDSNFAIRILEVQSREERIRSLG